MCASLTITPGGVGRWGWWLKGGGRSILFITWRTYMITYRQNLKKSKFVLNFVMKKKNTINPLKTTTLNVLKI